MATAGGLGLREGRTSPEWTFRLWCPWWCRCGRCPSSRSLCCPPRAATAPRPVPAATPLCAERSLATWTWQGVPRAARGDRVAGQTPQPLPAPPWRKPGLPGTRGRGPAAQDARGTLPSVLLLPPPGHPHTASLRPWPPLPGTYPGPAAPQGRQGSPASMPRLVPRHHPPPHAARCQGLGWGTAQGDSGLSFLNGRPGAPASRPRGS